MCGEMAGDPMCVAILIGLGYRHLSMNGRSVARVKYLLRRIDFAEAENLAQRSLEAQLATEVRHQVAAFMERRGMGGLIRGVIARIIYISFNGIRQPAGPLVLLFAPLERLKPAARISIAVLFQRNNKNLW